MTIKSGRYALLEQLIADGVDHIFGNPGTVEEGFLDALWDFPQLKYILTLQESIAVLTADGYARASGKPAVVQIHSTPGLGNSIGALYQAYRGHSPLVVLGGDAGVKYQSMDSQMAGDLVAFARPVTKWSTMVLDPSSLLRIVRRAIKIAITPPMGPVYVCLPLDVLDAPAVEEIRPTSIPSTRVIPDPAVVTEAARILASAQTPMLYVGDGVAFSHAQPELTRVAELLGGEVWGVDSGELNIALSHPLFQGSTGHMFGYASRPTLQKGDVNLICGTYIVPEVFPDLDNVFAPTAKSIHIDLNAYEIAKNHPVDLGIVSDPKLTLAVLADALERTMTPAQKQAASQRAMMIGAAKASRLATELEADRVARDATPLRFSRFMEELVAQLPADTMIFDEALTNSPALTRYFAPTRPRHYFQSRGGSLGVGLPGAIGVKLANPDKTVIGFSGDGGSMYTIQSLWTAVRHKVDAKFVICNNRSYRLLQVNMLAYWKERGMTPRDYPLSFDLSKPELRFVDLARGMGMEAVRIETVDQVGPAIRQALQHQGPFLLDVAIEGDVHPELIGVRCGQ